MQVKEPRLACGESIPRAGNGTTKKSLMGKIYSGDLGEEKLAGQKEWHLQAQSPDMVGLGKLLSVFTYLSPTWLSSLRLSKLLCLAQGGFSRRQTGTHTL